MKKFSLIISVLALVMGLSQCQKRPDMPTFGLGKTTPKEITFSVNGNGGQKGDFTQVTSVLNYKWSTEDKIYVYASGEILADGNQTDFSAGKFCGVMGMTSGADTEQAKFEGLINVPEATKTLRFVHYGTGVTLEGDATDGCSGSASFAEQNGKLTGDNSISSKVIALCDMEYDENQKEYEVASLTVQFGVVRFTFGVFGGTNNVTLSQLAKNGLRVNATGAVEYTDGATSTLSGMADNKNEYYTAFMPQSSTTYIFTDGSKTAYKKAEIAAGVFYTKKDASGESVALNEYPEGALHGEFTIGENKKVFFSQGNLHFHPKNQQWRFAGNQWDMIDNNGVNGHEASGYSSTADKWIDLFPWGTSNYSHGAKWYQPWRGGDVHTDSGNYYAYGTANKNLYNETGKADWGYNAISNGGNKENSGWRTLTKEEWSVLLNRKDKNEELLYGEGIVHNVKGLILLPDDWTTPDGITFTQGVLGWTNNISDADWTKMEDAGAVILPACGYRQNGCIYNVSATTSGIPTGYYWSSSYCEADSKQASIVYFMKNEFNYYNDGHSAPKDESRYLAYGLSVRLVIPAVL